MLKFDSPFIRFIIAGISLCGIPALTLWCFSKTDGNVTTTRSFMVMGGVPLNIKLRGPKEKTELAVEAAYQAVESVDSVCDRFSKTSELSKLNEAAYKRPFHCGDLLWSVLMESKRYYELTDGAFDISATPFMALWGFHRKRKTLPSPAEIADAAAKTGLNKVVFDEQKRTVRFSVPGMALDLGGIAKGYAVGLAAEAARKFNIDMGVINLAGNAYCFPKPPPGRRAYLVGVRHPLDKSKTWCEFEMLDESVATSGNYERYVVIGNKHYTHIMNPKTGRPVENMLSVTVVTPKAVDSDALSTSVFIKGANFAEKVVKRFPRTSILIIKREPGTGAIQTKAFGNIWN